MAGRAPQLPLVFLGCSGAGQKGTMPPFYLGKAVENRSGMALDFCQRLGEAGRQSAEGTHIVDLGDGAVGVGDGLDGFAKCLAPWSCLRLGASRLVPIYAGRPLDAGLPLQHH
jgi:hypothetical protein